MTVVLRREAALLAVFSSHSDAPCSIFWVFGSPRLGLTEVRHEPLFTETRRGVRQKQPCTGGLPALLGCCTSERASGCHSLMLQCRSSGSLHLLALQFLFCGLRTPSEETRPSDTVWLAASLPGTIGLYRADKKMPKIPCIDTSGQYKIIAASCLERLVSGVLPRRAFKPAATSLKIGCELIWQLVLLTCFLEPGL